MGTFSARTTPEKLLVMGVAGPTLPTSATIGEAGAALAVVNSWAQAYGLTGTGAGASDHLPPQAWEQWLVAEAAARIALTARPDRYNDFKNAARKAFLDAIDSINTVAADVSTLQGQTITIAGIRGFVLNHCARRRPLVLPQIADIDAHTQWVLNFVWHRNHWMFRKRMVTVTLPTTGIPTFDLASPETFWANATRRWYYTDAVGVWIDEDTSADGMAMLLAAATANGTEANRPTSMRMERKGASTIVWHFHPTPDQTYTLRAEVLIDGPGTPANATDTVVFAKFPTCFLAAIRDMVLARVLVAYSATDSTVLWGRAIDQIEQFLPQYESKGATTATQTMRDVYGDTLMQEGSMFQGGRM